MEEKVNDTKKLVFSIMNEIMKIYWGPMYKKIEEDPSILSQFTGFLIHPEKIVLYLGVDHLAIEYIGNERIEELRPNGRLELQYFDYPKTDNLMKEIIGFDYDSTSKIEMPLIPYIEEMFLPTNRGFDKLSELKWNFAAQDSIMGFNSPLPKPIKGRFSRIVNSFFFDADEYGLKTRHIKWIDLVPIECVENENGVNISFDLSYYPKLLDADINYIYPLPTSFKYKKLQRLNRFVEFYGNSENNEPKITSYLNEKDNQFILTMYFAADSIHHQVKCEWQSEDKEPIQPDYFVVKPNGYADIVEFKLPSVKNNVVVGRTNREAFSSEINSYISQTRSYRQYFDDPNNRKWIEDKYGIKVFKPRRYLVIGRRSDFENEIWKEIVSDYNDLEIITYDDLLDGVRFQFYR